VKKRIFKYEAYLKEVRETHLIPCPVEDAEALNIETFRWVNDPMMVENFLPTQLLDEVKGKPIRTFPFKDRMNCIYHSLSLYVSEAEAKKKCENFPPSVKRKLGYTHIAVSEINENDGESTVPDKNGHFSFFKYHEAMLLEKFKIPSKL